MIKNNFGRHFTRNCVKKIHFQSNSVMNSLNTPKTKSLSHCLTELFPIYQNNIWTIRRWDDHTIIPLPHRIILKIVGFYLEHEYTIDIALATDYGHTNIWDVDIKA